VEAKVKIMRRMGGRIKGRAATMKRRRRRGGDEKRREILESDAQELALSEVDCG
jgi:hypothetical protein